MQDLNLPQVSRKSRHLAAHFLGQGREVHALRNVPIAAINDGALPSQERRPRSCDTLRACTSAPTSSHSVLHRISVPFSGM